MSIWKRFFPVAEIRIAGGKKGVAGGYVIAKPAGQIKIAEIFDALESPATKIKCIDAECAHEGNCLTKILWCKMQAAVSDFLNSITLADLIDKTL